MPSLANILTDTFLATADPACKSQTPPTADPWTGALTYPLGKDTDTQRIWTYTYHPPTTTSGPKVTNLYCRVREFSNRLHKVAETITWGPVKVHLTRGGKLVGDDLPLTSKYVLEHYNSAGGAVTEAKAAASRFWKLEAQTDVSFQTVYGYHWYPDGYPAGDPEARVQPLPPAPSVKWANPGAEDFMPNPGSVPPPPEVGASGGTVVVRPIRVIVVVSLMCNKERKDWEPGKTIGAARLYPLIMVMADHDLKLVDATVTLDRPLQCLDNGAACHPEAPSEVGAVLFTDSNTASGALPTWDGIFDYFDVNAKSGTYKVVRRDRWQDGRQGDPAWVQNQEAWGIADGGAPYTIIQTPHPVQKKGFQGEFDNLHIAPRMVGKAKYKPYVDQASWRLESIVMAPFCLHDCLHVHWRWGTGGPPGAPFASSKHLNGWAGTDKPLAVKGNPLVPQNQDVFLTLRNGGSGFSVFTQAYDCKAGAWQVVFHNGAAYGVSIGGFGELARAAPELLPPIIDGITGRIPWPEFYWHLRFTGFPPHDGKSKVLVERLRINDLAKLRDL